MKGLGKFMVMSVVMCSVLFSATAGNTEEQQFTPPKMRYGIFYDVAYGDGAPLRMAPATNIRTIAPSPDWQTVTFRLPHTTFTHYHEGKSKLTLMIQFVSSKPPLSTNVFFHQVRVRPVKDKPAEWLSVTAGEANDTNAVGRIPGVYFYYGDWDPPTEYKGKMARRWVKLQPTVFVESPDPNYDLEVEVTVCTDAPLEVKPYGSSMPCYDLRTKENIQKLFDRVSGLGINMVTYAYAFTPPYAKYPTDNPKFTYPKQWAALGFDPVATFLDEAKNHEMEAFLGIWMGIPRENPDATNASLAVEAMEDIVKHYGNHPGLTGLTSPTEAIPPYWPEDVFAEVCRKGKNLRKNLLIMDYPHGPHGPVNNANMCAHAHCGSVDIMNVQFHVGIPAYFDPDFLLVRGWTQYVIGGCAPTPTLIHTHYKESYYCPGSRGNFYTPKSEAWKVRLGALLTATPYGCHQFTYLYGFHGADGISGEDTLWRWAEWSKAILFVQRFAPYYSTAHNCAPIGILVPLSPSTHIQDNALLWRKVVGEGKTAQFVNTKGGFGSVKLLLIPDGNLSNEEVAEVSKFVQEGGTAVLVSNINFIGPEWVSVTAGEPNDTNAAGRIPGVYFYYGDWDKPVEHNGKMARRWVPQTSLAGQANIFVENPDPSYDIEIEGTLCTDVPLTVDLWSGNEWVNLGKVEPSGGWQTVKFVAPHDKFVHYSREGQGILSLLLQFTSQSSYDKTNLFVHSVKVRRTGEKGKPSAKVKFAISEGLRNLFGITPENIASGTKHLGAGKLLVAGADELGKVIKTEAPSVPRVEGAGNGWTLEAYEVKEKDRSHRLYLLMAGKDGAEAKDVVLHLPDAPSRAMLINSEGVQIQPMVKEGGGSKVKVGYVHEWAAVVVGEDTYPALFPTPVVQSARVGKEISITVRVANPGKEAINGRLHLTVPEGWKVDKNDLPVAVASGKWSDMLVKVKVPETAEKEVYFIKFSFSGLEQRALVFVEDGTPRRIWSSAK